MTAKTTRRGFIGWLSATPIVAMLPRVMSAEKSLLEVAASLRVAIHADVFELVKVVDLNTGKYFEIHRERPITGMDVDVMKLEPDGWEARPDMRLSRIEYSNEKTTMWEYSGPHETKTAEMWVTPYLFAVRIKGEPEPLDPRREWEYAKATGRQLLGVENDPIRARGVGK